MITIPDTTAEALRRGIVQPLFRAAGVGPALVRITLVQARPINAFGTTGNRMFAGRAPIRRFASPPKGPAGLV